jgi:hypothetical protein
LNAEDEIETWQRRKIPDQRMRVYDSPEIHSTWLRQFRSARLNIEELAGADNG